MNICLVRLNFFDEMHTEILIINNNKKNKILNFFFSSENAIIKISNEIQSLFEEAHKR